MLRVALVAAILYVASADTYQPSPSPPYHPGGNSYGPDPLLVEVENLIANVSILETNDENINIRIRNLIGENRLNSLLTEMLNNEIVPGFRKDQTTQNDDLTELERQAETILRASDDVEVIHKTIREIQEQVVEIEKVNAKKIRPAIDNLRSTDQSQNSRLDHVESRLTNQENQIDDLVRRSTAVRDRIIKIRNLLHDVFNVINAEDAETIEYVLTNEEPEVTRCLSATFNGRVPDIQYGFVALHVTDHSQSRKITPPPTYGDYASYASTPIVQNIEVINWNVDIEYDAGTNKATARLSDLSQGGWKVEKVVIRAVFFFLEDESVDTHDE